MTMGISSAATASMLASILNNNRNQLTDLSQELSSGRKSQTLSGYGGQGQQLLDLNSAIAAANGYTASATNASTFLQAYDTTLTQLGSDANQLDQALTNLSDSTSSTSTASLAALVNGLEVDVSATLNTQAGNRYLYAGTRYNTAPAQAIGSLPLPGSPTPFTAVAAPDLPAYDTAAPGSDARAWAQSSVTVAPGETIDYGVSSADPAIQHLVYALQNAAAATTATEPNRSQFISLARSAVEQATTGLQALQATNGVKLNQANAAQTAQKQAVATLTTQLDGVQGVDTTALSVKISSLQTQMDASYRVTSSLLGLSLVTYLGSAPTG